MRVVAVDMDGTFLRTGSTYDRPRFERVHAAMEAAGCRLVVASGNQYEQLRSFFGPEGERMAFVSENGAMVRAGDETLFTAWLSRANSLAVLDVLEDEPEVEFIASGPGGGFAEESLSRQTFEELSFYYPRMVRVPDLREVAGELFKFSLLVPRGRADAFSARLSERLGGIVKPVTSGNVSVDLIVPGCHKASGLTRLLERWAVPASQAAAFGDSLNDREMLAMCGYGVAMGNAHPALAQDARFRAPSNNDDGVLQTLERWFLQ